MANQDILSQDEIDALLHGIDDGGVETEAEEAMKELTFLPPGARPSLQPLRAEYLQPGTKAWAENKSGCATASGEIPCIMHIWTAL